ncbi:hypothetical protein [Rodentibacter myodis]|uniref:Uncharacterized protein n=1 Tax=Rodentibacter myodis TaxID=1907939 RepID=A0A1V3JKF6_9PAST|nr:hypothetical protein [Rodentibacter myodis]OOF57290.1 hypothetical protein BKL49_09400 [Rodentibacter myodis]
MAQEYYFQIISKLPQASHNSVTRITATGILDAKNKFKALQPTAKIISCVKQGEYHRVKMPQNESSSIGGTLLTGLLAVAGTALAAKFLGDKK